MVFLIYIIILLILVLLMPTPTPPNAGGPSGLDDFNFPTADSSRSIPELYGTMWVFGNLIWYGNLKSLPQQTCA